MHLCLCVCVLLILLFYVFRTGFVFFIFNFIKILTKYGFRFHNCLIQTI